MSHYPAIRMRRLRSSDAIRRLVAESALTASDLVYPLFVHTESAPAPVPSMPGVQRHTLDSLYAQAEQAVQLGIPMVAIFPVIPPAQKDAIASEALNADGLIPQAVAGVKQRFPELLVMTDIALDPYTSHGHDGQMADDGRILNDETIDILTQQALMHAAAGADVLAPSDMMDGRIGAIRHALESARCHDTKILAYAAKYASAFYGPFRDAVGSAAQLAGGDKKTYQMNPANAREAMREIALDINEGADMVMVKPGLPYLDIITQAAAEFDTPVLAYQVSGEYAMLHAAAQNGWLNIEQCQLETLLAFKRAGACAILTYFAPTTAQLLCAV